MHDLNPLFFKDPGHVKVTGVQDAADLAGTIIVDTRSPRAKAAVGNIELVPVAPGATLFNFRALVNHVAAGQAVFYKLSDRASFDKGGQHLYRQPQ